MSGYSRTTHPKPFIIVNQYIETVDSIPPIQLYYIYYLICKGDPYWLTKLVKMSQDVLSLQEKHPNQWNSAKEIAKALGVPATYICTALKALRKSGLIAFQKVPMGKKKKPTFQYKFKW